MSTATIIIACICGLLGAVLPQTQGWRGIVPLRSTREDVERLIGPPAAANGVTYDLKTERVNIVYSDGGCARGQSAEWDVPPGVVIGVTVYPQTKLLLTDLPIDLSRFEKVINPRDPDSLYYNNQGEGISIGASSNGNVTVIHHLPSAGDNHLRCLNSAARRRSLEARPFDAYSDLAPVDEEARLDNLANYLRRKPDLIGYVIAYAGRQARAGEAKARARRAKNHLVNNRRIKAGRVVAIDGGHREHPSVELYALPSDVSPPAATPTVDPAEVRIIKNGGAKSND